MMTLRQLMAQFPTNEDCKRYLQERRWPDGVVKCPRCKNDKVYSSKARPFTWQCTKCGKPRQPYRFSVLVGTVFENTNYPLKTWFEVLWAMLNSKKGISALQIKRQIGCKSYETAWYMCMRLRAGMRDESFKQLVGIVEIDETYIGGKHGNKPLHVRIAAQKHHKRGGGINSANSGKVTVIGAIARKGSIVAKMIDDMRTETLGRFVDEAVSDKVSLVNTDEYPGYDFMNYGGWKLGRRGLPHQTVNHSKMEYVRGNVHTNNIESFWSLLKRGIIGSYHKVSKKYLPFYLNEFSFRFNNRDNPDMFGCAIAVC